MTTTLVLVLLSTLLSLPAAQAKGTTPSRHDVQQARQRAAAKARQVAAVRARLVVADQRLQQARITAEQASEAYNQARWKLQQATRLANEAASRALAAQQQLQQQRQGLVATVTASYEAGGQLASLNALFGSSGPEQLLSQYVSYEGVTSALQAGYERFTASSVMAEQFQKQADQARAAQSQLADQARAALNQAHQAESQAATISAGVTAERNKLTKQLARLQGISTALARERQRALARQAARRAARAAAAAARRHEEEQQSSPSGTDSGGATPPSSNPPAADPRGARAVAFAEAQLGDPYVYGAAGPNAWDCSGLTMKAWDAAGVSLPHSASLQYSAGTPIRESDLQPGDLIFWSSNPYDPATIYHVAMYVGNGKMIQAPQPGENVQIDPVYYWIPPSFFVRL